jgi:2-isopropylmalate synthase
MHVREVFKVELEENIRMISDSVKFLHSKGREVIYDAEHFFDGYKANRAYAMKAIGAALEAGASTIVLCDTNGGTVFTEVSKIVAEVKAALKCPLGIHTHNDGGLAVANALAAVEAGAIHVQGTVNGLGERCGNPDLIPIIADLQLKMGYSCLSPAHLKELTELARYVSEVSNMTQARNQPYAGMSAFAHKGGVHINAVMKNPETYEHIDPALVGNHRRFLVSELGGKTNITLKAKELAIDLDKESPEARKILQKVQEKENEGYQYEAAEASFELLVREVTGKRKKFFEIVEATVSQEDVGNPDTTVKAKVTVKVKGDVGKGAATGDGPVNALDNALRKALEPFFPAIKAMKLADFKVRVVNSDAGTAAKVRVTIESRDEAKIWTTIGVSTNVIDASWQALVDAIEYKLIQP